MSMGLCSGKGANMLALVVLFFLLIHVPPQICASTQNRTDGFKTVDLAGKYTIQIPNGLNCNLSPRDRYEWTIETYLCGDFVVEVLPYLVQPIHCSSSCVSSNGVQVKSPMSAQCVITEDTSGAVSDVHCDSQVPVQGSFLISGNRRVYFVWTVYDHAEDCKIENCFDPKTRYSVWYQFSVPDKEHGVIVLFDASLAFQQPSPTVTGFKGHAKALRDTIIPSLTVEQ
jgi:hypothetical protein